MVRDFRKQQPATDQEQPSVKKKDLHDDENSFSLWYFVVYGFAVLIEAVGIYVYFFPRKGTISIIVGAGLNVTGIFLLMNPDLLVSFVRSRQQIQYFLNNNQLLETEVEDQAARMQHFAKTATAFDKLDKEFDGDVMSAHMQMDRLRATTQDELVQTARALTANYIDANGDGIVNLGPEMDLACGILKGFFGNIFLRFDERWRAVRLSLYANASVQWKQGVSTVTFSRIIGMMLSEDDISKIPSRTKSIVDEME